MIRITAAILLVVALSTAVHADLIALQTDAPPGTPLTVDPGTTSGPMLMSVFQNGVPNLPTDQLTGWQTTLTIVPVGVTTGSVTFNTATLPSPYIFSAAAMPAVTSSLSMGGTQLLAFSSHSVFEAVTVPGLPGANILQMDFNVSGDALGTFQLVALDGPFQSEWNDNTMPVIMSRTFDNLPGTGAGVAIGEILVVPEPSSFFGLLTLVAIAAHKRSRH